MKKYEELKQSIVAMNSELAKTIKKINESNANDSYKLDLLNKITVKYIQQMDSVLRVMFTALDLSEALQTEINLLREKMDWLYWDRNVACYLLMGHLADRPGAEQADIDAFNRASYPEAPKHPRIN